MSTNTENKTQALRARLSESRVRSQRLFDDFRDTPQDALMAYVSRDAQLQEMLSRIRVNSKAVVYGEVPEHNLPLRFTNNQLA